MAPRVFALSDVHVDYRQNLQALTAISAAEHRDDALILAGDVSHDLGRLAAALDVLCARFAAVLFVPGNHELWVRGAPSPAPSPARRAASGFSAAASAASSAAASSGSAASAAAAASGAVDSLDKLDQVLSLCAERGVHTAPARVGEVWVVPLLSWYVKPGEGPDSLFRPKPQDDGTLRYWTDELFVRWPSWVGGAGNAAEHLLQRNEPHVGRAYDGPVVSFSHFLPRADLMYRSASELAAEGAGVPDRNPAFNFSRVAGTAGLERQIRALGSVVHVYGHQHRNRWRWVDGVLYVSHCLGYPGEWGDYPPAGAGAPRQVWPLPATAR